MQVNFYTSFAKRENSTKLPSSSTATAFTCVLKDESGILAPVIKVQGVGNPRTFNYAYISDFGRYYFVRDWTYYRGEWIAYLEVDALASWRTPIGGTTTYVMRGSKSAVWNSKIIDDFYPIQEPCIMTGAMFADPWSSSGDFVVGCIGLDETLGQQTRGAVNYYALDNIYMAFLCNYLMRLPEVTGASYIEQLESLLHYTATEAFKAEFNPIQYITGVRYFPFVVTQTVELTSRIDVGKVGLTGFAADTVKKIQNPAVQSIGPLSVPIPKHPQSGTRGIYLCAAPYSQYILDFPPFGRFDLDGAKMAEMDNLECTVFVDLISSAAVLEVRAVTTGGGSSCYMGTFSGSVGTEIQMAQISTDYLGALGSGLSAGASSPLLDVPYVGPVLAGLQGAATTLASVKWELNTTGINGTYLPYALHTPMLSLYYHNVTEWDTSRLGYPVRAPKKISTCGGFVQCAQGDVACAATKQELETIRSAMLSGFFYE